MQTTSAHAYKETKVKTASQGQIIVMLYDAAIRNIDQAVEELRGEGSRLDIVNAAFQKARDIVTELSCSLDMETGGEFATRLFNLYIWFNRQLMEANFKKDIEPAVTVRNMLLELRDAWATIAVRTNVEGRASSGLNIAG